MKHSKHCGLKNGDTNLDMQLIYTLRTENLKTNMLKELIILIDTCRTDKEKKKTDMPKELIIPIKTLQNVMP